MRSFLRSLSRWLDGPVPRHSRRVNPLRLEQLEEREVYSTDIGPALATPLISKELEVTEEIVTITEETEEPEVNQPVRFDSQPLTELYSKVTGEPLPGIGSGMTLAQLKKSLMFDDRGRVAVQFHARVVGGEAVLATGLKNMGAHVLDINPKHGQVSAFVDVLDLPDVTLLDQFAGMTAVWRPQLATGLVPGQGDPVINGPTFRTITGRTGAGVTVGVLSDSVNRFGGGLAASQATGDLPPNVNVILDGPAGSTDEGRAMLEIIHDIAPGAGLAFHSAFPTAATFANGIRALAAAGSQVIVDDVRFFASPMFNDGIIAQAADDVKAQGVHYSSSAGNQADEGWQDNFRGVTATVGGVTDVFHDLDPGAGTDVLQNFSLAVGATILISMQWDNAFLEGGSALPNFQVPTNMDVLLTNATTGALVANFNTNNIATDEAAEIFAFTNTAATGTTNFALSFRRQAGPNPNLLRWVSFFTDPNAQGEGAPTIFGQPVAAGAVAVGAVPWFDPDTPENFTSLGGNLPILFDRNGTRLAVPSVRVKPEMAAPDGVNTTFFPPPPPPGDIPNDPDLFPNFFGTSAAAPHVAAAAALLLEEDASRTPDDITRRLMDTAIDVAPTGFDFLTGAGRIVLIPADVGLKTFRPVRYSLIDEGQNLYEGNLTILNATLRDINFSGILVISNLPPGVSVINADGYSPNGTAFFNLPTPTLQRNIPVRIKAVFRNESRGHISTFLLGYTLELRFRTP